MSLKKINFENKEVDKKKFYSSKEAILLDSVDLSKIVVSSRCKINDTTYKFLCGYLKNNSIKPLCVILPQLDGYIKCHLLQMMRKFMNSIIKYGK